jgi:hypothetical protein
MRYLFQLHSNNSFVLLDSKKDAPKPDSSPFSSLIAPSSLK